MWCSKILMSALDSANQSSDLSASRGFSQQVTVAANTMICDVSSPLFRSFLSQKGGAFDKRRSEEQKPKEQKPKSSENKPVMTE